MTLTVTATDMNGCLNSLVATVGTWCAGLLVGSFFFEEPTTAESHDGVKSSLTELVNCKE